jgi:hypothetical protein
LREFRAAFAEKINARRVDSIGFHGGICHREKKKNPGMRKRRQNKHAREKEVNPVAVGPLEKQLCGFHFSSDVAMTVG